MWQRIKKILQKEGGKCIIVEDGQPTYLVMKMEDYEKMSESRSSSETEEVNRDIDEWKANQKEETEVVGPENQEVKVEDLPF